MAGHQKKNRKFKKKQKVQGKNRILPLSVQEMGAGAPKLKILVTFAVSRPAAATPCTDHHSAPVRIIRILFLTVKYV